MVDDIREILPEDEDFWEPVDEYDPEPFEGESFEDERDD